MARKANYTLDTPLKRNLFRLMIEKGFNAKSLSLRAGLNETAVRDILDKSNPTTETLRKLGKALGVDPHEITKNDEEGVSLPQSLQNNISISSIPPEGHAPVYGVAAGSTDRVAINEGSIIGMRKRNATIEYVKNAFYVEVIGDSMEPNAFPGQYAAVNPAVPLAKGQNCLVEFNNGEAVLKVFHSWTDTHLRVYQYNPRKDIKYDKSEIRAVHSVTAIERR